MQAAIRGGADVIQLRDKQSSDHALVEMARLLLTATRRAGIPLIVNDRIHVAKESGADGVHLGQEDGSCEAARAILGNEAIIGRSTHSPDQVIAAQKEGFDYMGVGPVFQTPTKPTYEPVGLALVSYAASNATIPFVAIGGINSSNVSSVRQAGAKTVAVVRAVMASEDPEEEARHIKEIL